MSRYNIAGSDTVELAVPRCGGQNTALSFSEIQLYESPKSLNGLPGQVGSNRKRPGTVPLTTTAIGSPIKVLCNLRKAGINNILASAGTTLYKYAAGVFTGQTMTNALNSADIDTAQFKDQNGAEVLIIADGAKLKYFDDITVKEITPVANDASPLPANDLANINAKEPPIGCLVHNTRVVIWGANTDTIHHSKIGFYDYFPQTDFQRFVRENDYLVGCASFSGALLVFMRRHIGVLFGDGYASTPTAGDWSQDFLDTTDGCINAKSIQTVVYPDGREEVFYQTDMGVSAVYTIDTISMDNSARFSTRSATKNQVDWDGLGITKTEWQNATSYFVEGRYWLVLKKGAAWQGLVFDTNDQQWYPIDNIKANAFYHDENYFYFAGDDGHLKAFDPTLYSDYDDAAKTIKTPINWYWYSKLMTPKLTGFDHMWDILLIEAKQHMAKSTIDVEVNTYSGQYKQAGAIKTAILIVGLTEIGEAQIANVNLTDIINNAKPLRTFLKGQYAQVNLSNNRDEPVEVFSMKYEIRLMTRY